MVLCKISTYRARTNAYKKPIKKPHLLAMNVIEKRDFIHSHLHRVNEKTINEFYEKGGFYLLLCVEGKVGESSMPGNLHSSCSVPSSLCLCKSFLKEGKMTLNGSK